MTMRLGLHLHTAEPGSRADLLARDYIRRVRPPMVKVLGAACQPGFLDFCREQGSEIVGRVGFGPSKADQPLGGAKAGKKMREIRKRALANPQITWWEFYNESYNGQDDEERQVFTDYADLCIAFMEEMEDIGRKAAIGSFSIGTPPLEAWERFRGAVEHAWHNGHAICLHEYSAPDMRFACGDNRKLDNGDWKVDDPCADPTVRGHFTLRYRHVLEIFRSWGLSAQLFIGESGNDDLLGKGPGQGKGWRTWIGSEFLQGDFADQMRWYNWQLSHDPEVIGVVDYGWAPTFEQGDEAWHGFDLAHVNDPGNAELAALRERLIEGQLDLPRLGKPETALYAPRPDAGGGPIVIPTPILPQPPVETPFPAGSRVRSALSVALRIRRTPGFVGKAADDVVGRIAPGGEATVIDGAIESRDGLGWLRLGAQGADGGAVEGWAATAGPEGDGYLVRV
jgi:hypothetical protein